MKTRRFEYGAGLELKSPALGSVFDWEGVAHLSDRSGQTSAFTLNII
jgi:hypothetical protein